MMSKPIDRLLDIMRQLRDPEHGCDWDKKQNFASIAPYTIEEAYEVVDAITRDNISDLQDELGDLLLQVVFHSQIASEAGYFDFNDVATSIAEKLHRRHPHVFGGNQGEKPQAEAVKHNWEQQKKAEKEKKGSGEISILSDIPPALPGLIKAIKIQSKTAQIGFEWPDYRGALDKVKEELSELEVELTKNNTSNIESEFGDLLFSICNLCRYFNVSPEIALQSTNHKFTKRFNYIENKIKSFNENINNKTLKELDDLWNEAKIKCAIDKT